MRIYITHCSAKKEDSLKFVDKEVSPKELYTATTIQRFIHKCIDKKVNWAIFSDLYGIWFQNEKHIWYEKHPGKVTNDEFEQLVEDFDRKLKKYDDIFFYYNPGRFHKLYRNLLDKTKLKNKVQRFTHIDEIS